MIGGDRMKIDEIKNYKILESTVKSDVDAKHIGNYNQLIKFFENALRGSIKDGKTDYNALHDSCVQCIRYLDNLVYTYEGAVEGVRLLNNTLDKIIDDSKTAQKLGNEKE
jgi:hypothetical protein